MRPNVARSVNAPQRITGERRRTPAVPLPSDSDLVTAGPAEAASTPSRTRAFSTPTMPKTPASASNSTSAYDYSPVVCAPDTEAPPWDRRTFAPTVRAGHRALTSSSEPTGTLFDRIRAGLHAGRRVQAPRTNGWSTRPALVGMPYITSSSKTRTVGPVPESARAGPARSAHRLERQTRHPTRKQSSGERVASHDRAPMSVSAQAAVARRRAVRFQIRTITIPAPRRRSARSGCRHRVCRLTSTCATWTSRSRCR